MIFFIIGLILIAPAVIRWRGRKNPDRYLPTAYVCREEFLNDERYYSD